MGGSFSLLMGEGRCAGAGAGTRGVAQEAWHRGVAGAETRGDEGGEKGGREGRHEGGRAGDKGEGEREGRSDKRREVEEQDGV